LINSEYDFSTLLVTFFYKTFKISIINKTDIEVYNMLIAFMIVIFFLDNILKLEK